MAVSVKGRRQERLEKLLLKRSRELELRLRKELTARVREAPNFTAASARDEGDLSNVENEQDMNCRRINSCSRNLSLIAEALRRLRQATYGVCEECGAAISEKRLRVVPLATHCLECQETLEDARAAQRIAGWLGEEAPAEDH